MIAGRRRDACERFLAGCLGTWMAHDARGAEARPTVEERRVADAAAREAMSRIAPDEGQMSLA